MRSHVNVADSFVVEKRALPYPVKVVLRDDGVVELYSVEEGLERYAGTFSHASKISPEVFDVVLKTVRDRIKQAPTSEASYYWLAALKRLDLLEH